MQPPKPPTRIILTGSQVESMRADVIARSPQEACGLLAGIRQGETVVVREVHVMVNVLHSPVRYRLDPQQQIDIFFSVEQHGLEVVGFYHSHPKGPNHPSEADLCEADDPQAVYLIWYPQSDGWKCRGFTIQGNTSFPVELTISQDQ